MTDELVLYTHPMSRGRIARWMLEEVGRPYRTELLDYGTTMKAPAYLAINPMGKVPALRHGAAVVTECAAICAYLADAFPAAGLAPAPGDRLRGEWYRWLFFGAGPLEAATTNHALGVQVPDDKRGFVGYGSLQAVVDALDAHLASREWFVGDRFSAVDVYVGSQVSWGLQFGTIDKRPALAAYAARLGARPAARRAREIDDALSAKAAAPKG
jgi:glutathione S-transferase